jgi:phage baseplate assembly protein W
MSDQADFIGRGLAFPLGVDQSASIAMSSGVEVIEGSINMVLMTAPGERLMRPEFGCRIWELLFEPINANTLGLMDQAVRDALGRWEPRITVDDVRIKPDQHAESLVNIEIDYTIRATNDRRNLVYPFYVIPGEHAS